MKNIDSTQFFSVGNNNDLMDLNSGETIIDERLKKITDNINNIYNSTQNNDNFNNQPKQNNQNLYNSMNPQGNFNNMNISQPNINIQTNLYNFNQIPNNTNNQINSTNNNFYNGMNMGYNTVHNIGNNGVNVSGYGSNYVNPSYGYIQQQNNPYSQNINYQKNLLNNNQQGFLSVNDVYNKKENNNTNLNFNQNVFNANFIYLSEKT